jgi:F1F0 ATPase subunit 2
MTWVAALTTGAGMGLAYFFGLWLTVQQVMRRQGGSRLIAWSRIARVVLAGLVFCGLGRHGSRLLVMGLIGFWLARGIVICRFGGVAHDQ